MMSMAWIAVAALAIAVEFVATHFVLFFAAIGALLAAALAAAGVSPTWQLLAFAAATATLPLLLRRPLLRRFTGLGVPSRSEDLHGAPALVTETVDPHLATGRVTVRGQDWAATSRARIEAGGMSRVVGSDGIVLIVEPAPPHHSSRS